MIPHRQTFKDMYWNITADAVDIDPMYWIQCTKDAIQV